MLVLRMSEPMLFGVDGPVVSATRRDYRVTTALVLANPQRGRMRLPFLRALDDRRNFSPGIKRRAVGTESPSPRRGFGRSHSARSAWSTGTSARAPPGDNVVFLHTGGAPALFAYRSALSI